jgi:hypothetical protein
MTSYATSRLPPAVAAGPSKSRMRSLAGGQRCTHAPDRTAIATLDRRPFEAELLAHLPLLRRAAPRRVGRLDTAEDLVRETVARARPRRTK